MYAAILAIASLILTDFFMGWKIMFFGSDQQVFFSKYQLVYLVILLLYYLLATWIAQSVSPFRALLFSYLSIFRERFPIFSYFSYFPMDNSILISNYKQELKRFCIYTYIDLNKMNGLLLFSDELCIIHGF
jgi:hypothetical protein